jgi:hypothetical protein
MKDKTDRTDKTGAYPASCKRNNVAPVLARLPHGW